MERLRGKVLTRRPVAPLSQGACCLVRPGHPGRSARCRGRAVRWRRGWASRSGRRVLPAAVVGLVDVLGLALPAAVVGLVGLALPVVGLVACRACSARHRCRACRLCRACSARRRYRACRPCRACSARRRGRACRPRSALRPDPACSAGRAGRAARSGRRHPHCRTCRHRCLDPCRRTCQRHQCARGSRPGGICPCGPTRWARRRLWCRCCRTCRRAPACLSDPDWWQSLPAGGRSACRRFLPLVGRSNCVWLIGSGDDRGLSGRPSAIGSLPAATYAGAAAAAVLLVGAIAAAPATPPPPTMAAATSALAARSPPSSAPTVTAAPPAPPPPPKTAVSTEALSAGDATTGSSKASSRRWVCISSRKPRQRGARMQVAPERGSTDSAPVGRGKLLADFPTRCVARRPAGRERAARLEHERLHLLPRTAQDAADLLMREVAQLHQHQRRPLLLGQAPDVREQRAQVLAHDEVGREVVWCRLEELVHRALAARAQQRQAAIAGDRVQPRSHDDRLLRPEEIAVRGDKRVLNGVLGFGGGAQQVAAERQQGAVMPIEEDLEGTLGPEAQLVDEALIGGHAQQRRGKRHPTAGQRGLRAHGTHMPSIESGAPPSLARLATPAGCIRGSDTRVGPGRGSGAGRLEGRRQARASGFLLLLESRAPAVTCRRCSRRALWSPQAEFDGRTGGAAVRADAHASRSPSEEHQPRAAAGVGSGPGEDPVPTGWARDDPSGT